MIAFIFTLVLTVISAFIAWEFEQHEVVCFVAFISGIAGLVIVVVMLGVILCEHIGVDVRIEEKRIEYEALCERYEIATSEYEDVSRSDIIKDVAEWNKEVYTYKQWAYNPWTNWFYSRRLADELKMIDRAKNTNSIVEH